MWKSLTPAVVLGLLNRLTCWWTAPGPFVAPQWRTHQKGPHLSGMATVSSGLCPAEMVLQSAGVRGQHRWWQQSKSWNPKSTLAVLSSQNCRYFYIYIYIPKLTFHLLLTQRTNLQCNPTVYFTWSSTSSFYRSKCNTNIVAYQTILIISLYPPAGLNYDPEPCHYRALTLLSLSSSFFNHSKSLYLLLTQESFSLKMGRFVCTKKEKKLTTYPLI